MKILIIEAEKKLQEQLISFFHAEHYDILTIENGVSAIEYFKTSTDPIDIILCDLDPPTQNGLKFLQYCQHNQVSMPFVFLTTTERVHDIIYTLERGAWNYFLKPVLNFKTLLVSIEQLCHREQLLTASNIYRAQVEENFKDLEEDHLSGYKLQQQLLPRNNQDILSLNFNYFLHPSLYISGDFVDYQQLADRYVIFYLSDVSGHGVGSAFVTVLLKACVQQYCSEFMYMNNNTAIDPKSMLSTINKVVCTENLGKYLTMVYMVYDQKLSKLTYSVAGHYPFPVFIEQNKIARYIGERGYPIGMFLEAKYENYEINLPEEFHIAMFSDGIMELRDEPTLDEKEKFILDTLSSEGIRDLEVLKRKFSIQTGKKLPDDVTGLFISKS